jgi:hypothetical protein
VNSGGTLEVGQTGATGTLTVVSNLTLSGTTLMELDAATVTNDMLVVSNTVSYGGTLTVGSVGGFYAAGQKYKLFSAGTIAGSFTTVTLPTLTGSIYWTNKLLVDGTIEIIPLPKPAPTITFIGVLDGNLVIRGTNNNGVIQDVFYLLTHTNLGASLSNWTRITTNLFDASGNLNYTNGPAGDPNRFYIILMP